MSGWEQRTPSVIMLIITPPETAICPRAASSRFPSRKTITFSRVCRYVDRNAYTAGLCDRPDQWRFGSLWRWAHGTKAEKSLLAVWPIPRRPNWIDFVAAPLTDKEQKAMQRSISRDVPFGDEARSREAKKTAQIPITVPDTFPDPDPQALRFVAVTVTASATRGG